MNKLIKLIALLIFTATFGVNAQQTGAVQGTPAAEYPVLINKLNKSEKSVADPKKSATAKFWLTRANLMMDIYQVNLQYLTKGAKLFNMTIYFGEAKEIKKEEKDGKLYETHIYDNVNITYLNGVVDSYEETNPIHKTPLQEALAALEKAEELDTDKKLEKKIVEGYVALKPLFERAGLELYLKDDFEGSFKNFETSVIINSKDILGATIDTTVVYNTGMVASKAGLVEESIKYYEMARANNYPEPLLYVFLKNKYFENADTTKGLEILKEGFSKYSDDKDIVIELINYYLNKGLADEALNYIKIAQKKDPDNISLIFAEATLYDKKGEFEKAVSIYKMAIEKDPEFYNGYFNLGVVNFNQAQKLFEEAGKELDNNKYKELVKVAEGVLERAIEPMEKCRELKPEDKGVLDVLKTIYYRMREVNPEYQKKYDEIKALLD